MGDKFLVVTHYKSGYPSLTQRVYSRKALQAFRKFASLSYIDRIEVFEYIEQYRGES